MTMELNEQNNQILTKRERKELRRQEKAREKQVSQHSSVVKKWIKRLAMILVIAGAIGGLFWYGATRPTVPTSELLTVASDDWVKGNIEGTITLVEYLDFECEACGAYYPVIKRLSEEYKDRVKFIVRYFPLPGHKNSMTSASAVEAAGKQGRYWEMHDIVFENQRDWGEKQAPDPKIFENYARQIGLDMDRYSKDIASQEVKDRIERDRETGQKLGITGTPTFFLNGEKIQNPRGYEDFKILLQEAINKNKQ
jgi:protein-disulfide isomerase